MLLSLLFWQKTTLLKRLIGCPVSNSTPPCHKFAASLARENWFSTAALLLLALLAQACMSWPIREDWVFGRGALKRQELKQSERMCFLCIKECKLILVVIQNKMMNLQMTIIRPLQNCPLCRFVLQVGWDPGLGWEGNRGFFPSISSWLRQTLNIRCTATFLYTASLTLHSLTELIEETRERRR